jgi:septal ring factor EnvC (AmiA/AmiB activator)
MTDTTPQPTPVQGEPLPVVALKRYVTGFEHGTWFCREDAEGNWCDYQEATAEIARLQGAYDQAGRTIQHQGREINSAEARLHELAVYITELEAKLSTALAESGEMSTLLEANSIALSNWMHTYASDMCHENDVKLARKQIMDGGGTLAYIADLMQANRKALARHTTTQEEE